MPVEVGIWRLGEKTERVEFSPTSAEGRVEDILAQNMSIIDPILLLARRQAPTDSEGVIGLPAMDADGNLPLIEVPVTHHPNRAEGKHEQFVRVEWDHAVPVNEAVWEKGFFGNQNTVAKPKSKKWVHTVERLRLRWRVAVSQVDHLGSL